ncbi:hypothetical protein NFI96_009220, partial [Prochilodus magdalenae]
RGCYGLIVSLLGLLICGAGAVFMAMKMIKIKKSDFQYRSDLCHLQKFSDDSVVVGCIRDGQDGEYRNLVNSFMECKEPSAPQCDQDLSKTKRSTISPLAIMGQNVDCPLCLRAPEVPNGHGSQCTGLHWLGVLSVCVSSQAGLTVEAGPGDDVTLWCEHGLTLSAYIFWLKQTNNSAPVYMACRYYTASSPSSNPCYFITDSNRTVMEVNSGNSSLTITAVQDSDSGLYYCSTQREQYMIYSTTTYLHIRASCTCNVVPTLVFGGVIVVLLSVLLILLFIILKNRRHYREDTYYYSGINEEPDVEMVNYAALHLSNKKNKRSHRRVEAEDPHIVYSSVRQ